ncbi:uncharacterized protein LOC125649680 isoform X7 [Ostrea edulis]|uniref:uncharacterized protein LOC125649680 isoform X7 n=1 Tax=Ostrea edulis TaxID=37623 RepID=UPI0024AF83E5|nr:uncharacterized protein LOC125649680 isoform X7 [Ostrea edulis]
MSNVKVAVRVRPLSQREKDGNSKSIVEVHGDSLSILNAKVDQSTEYGDSRERIKHFTFDYCYDSSGAPQTPGYASQQLVFQDLGTEVLQAAFEGYNACLFAYGQTSTGKTYTMMGPQEDFGIIPRICEGLFSHVDDCLSENVTFRVDISYLEIYNERVKDLLRPSLSKSKEKFTLKVREHPKEGPYVQDLSSHYVKDNMEIQELLDRGNESRTTASTYMHDRSSRSHAIVTISFTQARLEDDLPHEIVSKIHLVDLAGSERADPNFSEHYKGRLKEGANINRSLVTLGNVIKALAERSLLSWSADNLGSTQSFLSAADTSPKRLRLPYIPYRDSVLTWLLKDSLGGNSKTIMIATITPANIYYSETISTLRYAQRAKSIINKPKINEDPNVTLIRELRQEIWRLRDLLKSAQMNNPQQVTSAAGSALAEKLLDHENMAKKLTQTWRDKWTETHDIIKESDLSIRGLKHSSSMGVMIESQMPHLVGMDDDVLSTGVTIYHLKEGKTLVGREDADRPQDIVLRGPAVKQEHCFFKTSYSTVTLHPNRGAQCAVNGMECKDSMILKQGDYVLLGKTNMFRFNNPAEAAKLRERRQSLNSSRDELSHEGSLESLDVEESDPYSYYNRRPFHPLYGPNYASPEICLQLERQYRNESERINQAKKELEQLRDDHQKAEEMRREREEELWNTHEEHRAEIQQDLEKVARMKEETQAQKDKAEAEIEYARECLQKEREAFYKKLEEELKNLQKSGGVSEVLTQTDLETAGHIKEAIMSRKQSGWGRVKDLLHGELMSRLQHQETEERLRRQSEDLEEQFVLSQRDIQLQIGKIKETKEEYKTEDAVHYQEISNKMREIEDLSQREEQLELYIEEKQDLLMVGVHQPHPLRTACSEEVLTVLHPTDAGFPTRTSSLMALPRGSEGDLPSCSNRLSMLSCDQSMEQSSNSLFEGSEASLDVSSSVDEGSGGDKRKTHTKNEKLVDAAKNVTSRLYKAPEPKFKYQPKTKQLPRSSGSTFDTGVRVRDRRSPISPIRESPARSISPRVSPGRQKSESPRSTPSPRQTPDRQLHGKSSTESKTSKKPGTKENDPRPRSDKTSSEKTKTAKKPSLSGKFDGALHKTSGTKKDDLEKKHLSPRDLSDIRNRRQSPTGSHGDISDKRLTSSGRQRDSDNSRLSPNFDGGGRKLVTRLRHISSASSLANVPEAIAEEVEPAEPEQKSTSQVVVKRRKKRVQIEGDEFRRHSEPLGEELAEAFDKYTQDFEQMEWQRTGNMRMQGRENVLNWNAEYPQNMPDSIPGSTSDGGQQGGGGVDSESGIQKEMLPTIHVEEYNHLDVNRHSREPSVYSETGSTVSDPSTVVETEIDESDRVVFMEGVETLSDDENRVLESSKFGSKRDHDVVYENADFVPVKVARTESDINFDNQNNLTTSQFPEGQTCVPPDSVSVSSDSLDDSKSVDSLECPRQRMENVDDEDSLDDSLDESDLQKSDTLTSQTSLKLLTDSTSTELLTSCDGLDHSKNLESPIRSDFDSSLSQYTTETSDLSVLPGMNGSVESHETKLACVNVSCQKKEEHQPSENVDSSSRRNEKTQEASLAEQDLHTLTKITEVKTSAVTDSIHYSQQPINLPITSPSNHNTSPSASETSAPTIPTEDIPHLSFTEDHVLSSGTEVGVPSSQATVQDKDSDSVNSEDSIEGKPKKLNQREQGTTSSFTTAEPSVIESDHIRTVQASPVHQTTETDEQGKMTESSSIQETNDNQLDSKSKNIPIDHIQTSIKEEDKVLAGDVSTSVEKNENKSDSNLKQSGKDSNKRDTADKSCDGIVVELTDTASQVNISDPSDKEDVTSSMSTQIDFMFPPSIDDTQEVSMELKPASTQISSSVDELCGPENEKLLSIVGMDTEEEFRQTVGVCTSPSLLCSLEDGHSCSNDSLQEVKEQLQELQEVLEGHIGMPPRGVYQVSPQLSSARRAIRQRAMIQRNGRLESGESDGTDHFAETAELAAGSQSKSCSRPTSGSRRRRRTQLKPYKKSGKCPYCHSSEEYQLTTESESLNSDTADISKGEELSQPDQSTQDIENSLTETAERILDEEDAVEKSENGNSDQKCCNKNHLENFENADVNKSLPRSGSLSSLNSEVEQYCSVLREIDDREQSITEDSKQTNMMTSLTAGDGTAHRPQKLRSDMNSADSSYGSVSKSGSRAASETRDSEQQTDLSSLDTPLMSPSSSLHSSLRSPRLGIHQLNISPVSVWSSDKSSSSPRKSRASGGLNTPTGRRTPRKHKESKLEMAYTDVWSTETMDPNSPPSENCTTQDSDVSSEEDNCYSLETETVSPQSPSSSDRFFDHGSFILESPPSGRAVPIESPVRYEVTVKEEETNVFYNVNKVEYKTYGLNSPTLSTTIPETININVTNTDTHRVENRDESVNHETVVFSRPDTESPTHIIVSERNFQGLSSVTTDNGHHVESQVLNEYGNQFVDEMGPPLTVQISDDPRGIKSLTSPIESDTTSDYGTMIGDGRRGNISFMSDSADESTSPRSKVTDETQQPNRYSVVGEQTVLNANEESIDNISPTVQDMYSVSPPMKRISRPQCSETSPSSEVASNVIQSPSAMDTLRNLIENPIKATTDDTEHSDEYDPTRNYYVEEICEEVHSSSSSSYTTPQQSPRLDDGEETKQAEEPQKIAKTTAKLLIPTVLKDLQTVSVNTDSQEPKAIPRKQTKDDGSLHRELKRELQQKLASLQRRVRSQSDSAISSDYHTDGDSTTVSPRGSRLYESDKILRFGEQLGPIHVMTSQTATPQIPAEILNTQIPAEILNTKALEIENKSVKKSLFKDSGNVFDDEDSGDVAKSEDDSKKENVEQEISDVKENKAQQRPNIPIEVTSSSEESDSDVSCERSLSPGEILINDYEVPRKQQTDQADEEPYHRYRMIKEKSPSMSDVPTDEYEEIRRSMSEACMDQYEEMKDEHDNSSNDSIVFVFMGQSHSKDSMEQLKSFTSKQPEYNILSSNEVLEDQGNESDDDNRSSNKDSVIQNEDDFDSCENWERRPRSYTDNEDDKPLRHKYGIDENVLPIPTRSMSSDNLPKQSLSQHQIHRSRSASLLEVNTRIDMADDSSNNEGIFPPCVETSERESQNTSDVKDTSTSAEIGDSDFSLTELETPRTGEILSDDMQYSRFPNHHEHPSSTHQHTGYNSTMRHRDDNRHIEPVSQGTVEFGTQTEAPLPTHVKGNRVLPGLDSPYRAKSTEELTRAHPVELHLSEDTETWQNLSSIVIENNARLQNLQNRLPGEYQCRSVEISTQRDDTTQTTTSLQDLETSSTQTDISFLTLVLSDTQTTDLLPSDLTEVDGNIVSEKQRPVRESVDYFDRLSREPSPVKQEMKKSGPTENVSQPVQTNPSDEITEKEYKLETQYSSPNLSANNSEMEKLKEEHDKMMKKLKMATENRKQVTEKLRQEKKPQDGVHEEFVAEKANQQHSFPPTLNLQSSTSVKKTNQDTKEDKDISINGMKQKNASTNQNDGLTMPGNIETVEDVLSDDEGCITPPTSPVTIETEIPSQDISVPLRSRLQHLSTETPYHTMVNGSAESSEKDYQNGGPNLKLDLSAITGEPDSQPITGLNNDQIKQKLDKLHKERVQVIELLSLNYLPASFTIELLEAKLNYCIGQTDLLLKSLDEQWDSDEERGNTIHQPHLTREYISMYREELQQSKTDVEICRERLERKQGTGRGRTKGRNQDFSRMKRNAEIEAFKVERMLELQNYQRSRTLHTLNNSFHGSPPERSSRSVSPTSSVHSSSQYMTPKQHRDHLVHLRKELVKHTESPEYLDRVSRSSSPSLHHRTTSHPSPRLHHDYLSPRSLSTQDHLHDLESYRHDYYSTYSPRDSAHSSRPPNHNRQLTFSPKIAFSVADELPSSVDYGYSTYLVPPQTRERDSPRSISSDARPPSNTLYSPTQLSTGSISPEPREPRFRPLSDQSLDYQPDSRNYYSGSESRQLLHEIEQIRLQNRAEIRRAQHILDSYSKKKSNIREAHMSAERLSSTPRCHYSSYSDYASDLLDARHRSISGTMSGTYELYDEEVSGLTARHRPPSPMSVVYDVEPYHGFDPHKIRPIRSTDIKAKLKRSHTTRR